MYIFKRMSIYLYVSCFPMQTEAFYHKLSYAYPVPHQLNAQQYLQTIQQQKHPAFTVSYETTRLHFHHTPN